MSDDAHKMCERYDRLNGEWEWQVRNFTCPRVGCGWHDPYGELEREIAREHRRKEAKSE